MNNDKIGTIIKKLRKERAFTQQELARGICDRTTIAHYENGLIQTPSIHILKEIASKFGMSIEEMLPYASLENEGISCEKRKKILLLLRDKCYEKARLLVLPIIYSSLNSTDRQFLLYIEGCYYRSLKQYLVANELFVKALFLTKSCEKRKFFTCMECRIEYALLQNYFYNYCYDKQKLLYQLDCFKANLMNCKEIQDKDVIQEMTLGIAYIYLATKQYEKAKKCLAYSEDIKRKTGTTYCLEKLLLLKAELAHHQKQVEQARRYVKHAYYFLKATEQETSIPHFQHSLQGFQIKELFDHFAFSSDM